MQTFLFDYGGTLDTSAIHWYYIFKQAYAKNPLTAHITDAQLRQAYVTGERTLASKRIIVPTDTFHDLLQKKVTIQVSALNEMQILGHIDTSQCNSVIANISDYCNNIAYQTTQNSAQILKYLKQHYQLIMVSNFYGNLTTVLNEYKLISYFDDIIESAVVGIRKPDPQIWALGVKAAGTDNKNCIVVGDSYNKDIQPADSIGCQTIWFKGKEWQANNFDETLPTHVITSLSDIKKWY